MILTSTIAFIIAATLLALLVVYFQYYFREKKFRGIIILALLRFISILGILILLVNPKIQQNFIETIKPKLLVAVDNSSSISFNGQDSLMRSLVKGIKESDKLKDKFDINFFTFGSSVQNNSELTFKEGQTNIEEAIQNLNSLTNQQIAPIILLSDGNQTYGNDYKYIYSKQPIYPIVLGDTTQIEDLEISKVNVNSYSFLNNNFPVEVFLEYTGNRKVNMNFTIEESSKIIYKQLVTFSKENNNAHIQINLPSKKIGKHLYRSKIEFLEDERNTINNFKNFSIEVIDEQTTIAIVYDILHPDIGMLKKSIESNKQRSVQLLNVNTSNDFDENIDLYLLYQPNHKFGNVFKKIMSSNKNYFLITGKQTDWNFLNNAQNIFKNNVIPTTEEFFAHFNNTFNKFKIENIGFDSFPPLEGFFGEITFSSPYESILTQSINGIETKNPLMSTFSDLNNNGRGIVLFGENLWKWRTLSFSKEQSFDNFDQFINSSIQYLTISKQSNPIELEYKSFYYTDEPIKISAKTYDSNFNLNSEAQLELVFNNQNQTKPFYFNGKNHELYLKDLKYGQYEFTVRDRGNDKSIIGLFNVLDYSIEQENLNVNQRDLELLANNSEGKMYYSDQFQKLLDSILENKEFVSVQSQKIKTTSLIDWKWLLGLIILSLSLEWFIRKYRGLI